MLVWVRVPQPLPFFSWGVAQLVEHQTLTLGVAGSSPASSALT